jgi:ABC-2 type transport system permease protein
MKQTKKLIKYELVNLLGSKMTFAYGLILPLGLALLFALISKNGSAELNTQLLIMFSSFVPLATMFGCSGTFANEIEGGSIARLRLFGISIAKIMFTKMVAVLVFITVSFVIYFAVLFIALPIVAPTVWAFIVLILFLYIFSGALFILFNGITMICGNFSSTYGVTIILVGAFMALGGIWGNIGAVGYIVPNYSVNLFFLNFWQGGTFNFLPLILSLFGTIAVAILALWFGVICTKYRENGNQKKSKFWAILFKIMKPI